MDHSFDEFRKRVDNYSIPELEELIYSLNSDRFPERYQYVFRLLTCRKEKKSAENIYDVIDDSHWWCPRCDNQNNQEHLQCWKCGHSPSDKL